MNAVGKAKTWQAQITAEHVQDPNSSKPRPEHGYWLTPPEIYGPLNAEFRFDFDPCPNPRPLGFDGTDPTMEWGEANWVNPPFWAGLTRWAKKAVAESAKGKDVAFIAPLDAWVNHLLQAGAEVRPVGFHDWIHTKTKKRQKAPRPSVLFILRGRKVA